MERVIAKAQVRGRRDGPRHASPRRLGRAGAVLLAALSTTPAPVATSLLAADSMTVTVKGDECEQQETCTIDSPSRSCLFAFPAVADHRVRITVRAREGSLSPLWRLVDATGRPAPTCGALTASTGADCGPLPAGAYTIQVSAASGTGTAAVHVQHLTACGSARIDCDQVVLDEIAPVDDSDLVRFSAAEGETVRLTVRELDGSLRAEWRLLTAAGTRAPACDTFRRSLAADCGPLPAGEYQIEIRDEPGQGTGTFAVHLQRLTAAVACDSAPIRCDQTVLGEVDPPVESDLYRFAVEDGEVVRVTLDERSGLLRAEWRLLTAAGLPAPVCRGSTTARAADCGPLPAGEYQVLVKDDTSLNAGTYELSVFFLAHPCANCGNGIVSAAEDCDPPGGCCTSACGFASAGTPCRAAAGACDTAEVCNGTSASCPADARSRDVCRPAGDACDVAERCDGAGNDCPPDALAAAGTVCRAAVAACDQAELCSGKDPGCSIDAKRTGVCRDAAGPCDLEERCDGTADDCPVDRLAPAGTECRPIGGACDIAETCSGDSTACPPDTVRPAGLVCRLAADGCDIAETCTGTGGACPADRFRSAVTVCRAGAGPCDAPEFCTGRAPGCPADAKRTGVCRLPAGPCDVAERCDGTSDGCPVDRLAPPLTVCRPAVDTCDVAERCSGDGPDCPAEIVLQGVCGDGCRDAGEQCGENGLGPCPDGQTCVGCRCVVCASALVTCSMPAPGDSEVAVDFLIGTGPRPLAAYSLFFGWDPTLLGLEGIAGGATLEFIDAPRCEVDPAGTALCSSMQTSRADGPSLRVHVARPRFRLLGSAASRPEVRLALQSLTDPNGEPIPTCVPAASCRLPECRLSTDCNDGDECTHEQCVEGGCVRQPPAGFAGVDCELRKVAAMPCGPDAIPSGLERRIASRIGRARRLLDRAARSGQERKIGRLIRKAERQLDRLQRTTQRSAKLEARCRTRIAEMIAERRRNIRALVP